MKKTAEILAEIRENRTKAEELNRFIKSAKWSERNEPAIVKAAEEEEILQIENKILHDNARRALYAEALPVILEELSKFKGKPYGEKTEKKISDAIKARINCGFYMRNEYSGTALHLIPMNENGFSGTMFNYQDFDIYTQYENGDRPRVLIDNKIQEVPADKFYLSYCAEYVENPREHAEKIRAEFAALKEARAAYERKCSEFNSLLPSGISHANPREPKNYLI